MGTLDINGFAASAERIALRLDSAALPGLLRRSLTVPEGCVAWVRDEDGREEILGSLGDLEREVGHGVIGMGDAEGRVGLDCGGEMGEGPFVHAGLEAAEQGLAARQVQDLGA